MKIFKQEMKEFKKSLPEKREKIKEIKRERWSENYEYQGEKKNGLRHGFGIIYGTGTRTGDKHELEFENGKPKGRGILRRGNKY